MTEKQSPKKRYEVSFVPNNDTVLLDEEKLAEKGITEIKDLPYQGMGLNPEGYELNLDEMKSDEMYVLHKGKHMNTGVVKEKEKLKIYNFFRERKTSKNDESMQKLYQALDISKDKINKINEMLFEKEVSDLSKRPKKNKE